MVIAAPCARSLRDGRCESSVQTSMGNTHPTPIIFLDLDGVLVPWESSTVDPGCVAELNDLIARTGARVVVTSAWRATHDVAEIATVLAEAGFVGVLDGTTPLIPGASRGVEIAAWLEQTGEPKPRFVILDDCADVGDLRPWLVQTDEYEGLCSQQVADAVAILLRE